MTFLRTIIIAAFVAVMFAPLSASANMDGYFNHCHAADAHQHNEGKFHFCINNASLACRVDCNRNFPDSSDYRACAIACNDYSAAHRNLESWRQ